MFGESAQIRRHLNLNLPVQAFSRIRRNGSKLLHKAAMAAKEMNNFESTS